MSGKQWDVFVSHASEDKATVAQPLANALRRFGARVWLDRHELWVGDSLTRKIDEGLANSRFGVVIISESFLSKKWPQKELAGLRAREESGNGTIIPVWHNVTKNRISEIYPIIADIVAGKTEDGIDQLALQIAKVIFSINSEHRSLSQIFAKMLDGTVVTRKDIVEFIVEADKLLDLREVLGGDSYGPLSSVPIGKVTFDRVGFYQGHGVGYFFSVLTDAWKDPFDASLEHPRILKDVKTLCNEVHASQRLFKRAWLDFHPRLLRKARKLYTPLGNGIESDRSLFKFFDTHPPDEVEFKIFCGRRSEIDRTSARRAEWRALRDKYKESRISIRTYDSILDVILRREGI